MSTNLSFIFSKETQSNLERFSFLSSNSESLFDFNVFVRNNVCLTMIYNQCIICTTEIITIWQNSIIDIITCSNIVNINTFWSTVWQLSSHIDYFFSLHCQIVISWLDFDFWQHIQLILSSCQFSVGTLLLNSQLSKLYHTLEYQHDFDIENDHVTL